MSGIDAVVLDVGNVLIEWDPRRLYRDLFDDADAMERFLVDVCNLEWLNTLDMGTPFDEAVAELSGRFPEHADNIAAFRDRWFDSLGDVIQGSVDILRELRQRGLHVYALTNFPAEMWEPSCERYPFLTEFDGAIVSGHERLSKPDRRIYERLTTKFGLDPARVLFADDRLDNVEAALAAGWTAVQFTTAADLRRHLRHHGVMR